MMNLKVKTLNVDDAGEMLLFTAPGMAWIDLILYEGDKRQYIKSLTYGDVSLISQGKEVF